MEEYNARKEKEQHGQVINHDAMGEQAICEDSTRRDQTEFMAGSDKQNR